jgi:dTMP kinase
MRSDCDVHHFLEPDGHCSCDKPETAAGHFIVLEGVDGSGKSTQAKRLAAKLGAAAPDTEPTNGKIGALLREMLAGAVSFDVRTVAALFAADRIEHGTGIRERLARGEHVVSDRYALSSIVYQSMHLTVPEDRRRMIEWVAAINTQAARPHLNVVLTLNAKDAAARIDKRSKQLDIFEKGPQLDRARVGYAEVLRGSSAVLAGIGPLVGVDAEGTEEEVERRIWRACRNFFGWPCKRVAVLGARTPESFATPDDHWRWETRLEQARQVVRDAPAEAVIVSGGAEGIDRAAESEALRIGRKVDVFPFPARRGNDRLYGSGPERNTALIKSMARFDEIHLLPWAESKGTWDAFNKARSAGVPSFLYPAKS